MKKIGDVLTFTHLDPDISKIECAKIISECLGWLISKDQLEFSGKKIHLKLGQIKKQELLMRKKEILDCLKEKFKERIIEDIL